MCVACQETVKGQPTRTPWAAPRSANTQSASGRPHLLESGARIPYATRHGPPQTVQIADVSERVRFEHPIYSFRGLEAQRRRDEISGASRTSYCGAYWGYGFHEDGVQSAVAATKPFGVEL